MVVSHLRYWAVRCMLLVEVNIGRERKNGCFFMYMGVFKNRGTPKWMVYNGKPYQNG